MRRRWPPFSHLESLWCAPAYFSFLLLLLLFAFRSSSKLVLYAQFFLALYFFFPPLSCVPRFLDNSHSEDDDDDVFLSDFFPPYIYICFLLAILRERGLLKHRDYLSASGTMQEFRHVFFFFSPLLGLFISHLVRQLVNNASVLCALMASGRRCEKGRPPCRDHCRALVALACSRLCESSSMPNANDS